ncbi:flavodoxin domain-containing protein [Geomicrobium sediminis]|uniref:Ribonucleotide reductase-associated flavodoxin n=1 Tax=Geomicrobium sediminis TaxID=1347788 RepID=A0ABS2P7U7_9BACL|nr:flavodoxin domain-containing protein [Geomicrobium sediminis]MBM7631479.1 putative ribonucleotide reductase-associated flavodoxin [Geomicrobium sediminis]
MKHVLVLHESLSGNTKRLADLVAELLKQREAIVDVQSLRTFLNEPKARTQMQLEQYDKVLIGTYTDDSHQPPELIEELLETYDLTEYNVAAFGTGDTQWGDSYCYAADVVAKESQSKDPVLKIEQMPAKTDLETIIEWLEAIGSE